MLGQKQFFGKKCWKKIPMKIWSTIDKTRILNQKNFEKKNWKHSKSNFCVPGQGPFISLKHPGVLWPEFLQGQIVSIYNVQKMLHILAKL